MKNYMPLIFCFDFYYKYISNANFKHQCCCHLNSRMISSPNEKQRLWPFVNTKGEGEKSVVLTVQAYVLWNKKSIWI